MGVLGFCQALQHVFKSHSIYQHKQALGQSAQFSEDEFNAFSPLQDPPAQPWRTGVDGRNKTQALQQRVKDKKESPFPQPALEAACGTNLIYISLLGLTHAHASIQNCCCPKLGSQQRNKTVEAAHLVLLLTGAQKHH